jgi:hypothetical protein
MATSDVRDILDIGVGDQGRAGQQADAAKPSKESIMNPFKVSHNFTTIPKNNVLQRFNNAVCMGVLCCVKGVCPQWLYIHNRYA